MKKIPHVEIKNYEPQAGDILACYGTDRLSRLISWATLSPFARAGLRLGPSHVSLVVGPETLIESTSMCPRSCLIAGKPVSGLQMHKPKDRIADYADHGGRVDVYRLTQGDSLDVEESDKLRKICIEWVTRGANYSLGGAALSGTRVFSLLKYFPDADPERAFCSEFVAWALQKLCKMNRDNCSRYNPGRLLRTLCSTGVYRRFCIIP